MCFKKTSPLQGCRRCGDRRLQLNLIIKDIKKKKESDSEWYNNPCDLQLQIVRSCWLGFFWNPAFVKSTNHTSKESSGTLQGWMGSFLKCYTRYGYMTGRHFWGQRGTRGGYQQRLFLGFAVVMYVTDWLHHMRRMMDEWPQERERSTFLSGTWIIMLLVEPAL